MKIFCLCKVLRNFCSYSKGGFGLASARRLDYYGFHVLAGVLSKESDGAKYLETYGSKRLRTIKLDVTKQEDIDDATELVAYLTNYKPILDKINEKQSKLNVFDRKFQNQFFGINIRLLDFTWI